MIEFQNIAFKYHYERYPLFQNLSFTLTDGTNTVLCDVMSGKTTLCKMLLGLVKPDSGKVLADGEDVFANNAKVPNILLLPQTPVFFQNKTVGYNLQYPLKVRKQKADADVLNGLACRFGLQDVLNQKVRTLSPTLQKKLALARGLTVPRQIVLFDGFFDNTCEEFPDVSEVLELFEGKTQVVLTDNPSFAAGNTVVLDGGTCVFQGNAEEAKSVAQKLQWLSEKLKKL